MEKRTLLAVVLSVIVIFGGVLVQNILYPPKEQPAAAATSTTTAVVAESPAVAAPVAPVQAAPVVATASSEATEIPSAEERVVIQTDIVRAEFTNRGGDMVSYKLMEHKENGEPLEMIFGGTAEPHAFSVGLGAPGAPALDALFNVRRLGPTTVEFYRDFSTVNGPVRLSKRYDLKQGEYLFELSVTVDGGFSSQAIDFGGAAYTLDFGPQIGPRFAKLSGRYEYRNYFTYANGKKKTEKVTTKGPTALASRVSWAAIAGKYFTFIAIPDATDYRMSFSMAPEPGLSDASRLIIERPPVKGSRATDTFRFYLGPKTSKILSVYDNADKNAYKLRDMNLETVADTSGILGPLETVLKWLLMAFYRIIPNYGVAIILVTLVVKLILFPLTKKGSESTIKMQALSPKIKELQAKYKDNPTKLNEEMAKFYKLEGYNPMSGCLPMLIQIPIFFAMYNLFNTHFDLRGAMFIPGWIPDLSLPETVWNFAPFQLPIVGWSDLRVLPFLYVGSQLIYGKVTQTPDQQNNSQMKMMMYAMPIIFFFILYDVPSGLLIYWIMSNLLTMVQQIAINKYLRGHHMLQRETAMTQGSAKKKSGGKRR